MKRLLTILLSFMALTCMAQKQNWLENLVNNLSAHNDIDCTVAVNRDPSTREITKATYDFRFSSSNLYKSIASDLMTHRGEVDFYSEETVQNKDKQKRILMRFTDNKNRWSCRLQPLSSKNKQFIVAVTSVDKNYSEDKTDDERSNGKQSHKKSRRNESGSSASLDNSSSSDLDELNRELDKAKQERKRKLNR